MKVIRSIDDFVKMLGGPSRTAEWLGVTPSYVSNMLARGYLPSGFHMRAWLEIVHRGYEASPEFFELQGDDAKRFSAIKKRAEAVSTRAA